MAHVGQDFAFLCRDAGRGVQASVLRLRDKGTYNRDAGGVAGDGVVDPIIVVGEPEVAQVTGDAACLGVGEEGRKAGDKKVEVGARRVLDAEVVND